MPRNVVVTMWTIDTEKAANGVPKVAGLRVDLAERLGLMAATVKAAAKAMEGQIDKDTERAIFLAPEYYFVRCKSDTPKLHYLTADDKGSLVAALEKLSATHEDLMMVPGTIGWTRPASTIAAEARAAMAERSVPTQVGPRMTEEARATRAKLCAYNTGDGAGKALLDRLVAGDESLQVASNTAVVLFGGRSWLYDKRYESLNTEDLSLDVPGFVDYANTVFGPGASPLADAGGKPTMGLEICADHEYGALHVDSPARYELHVIVSATVSPFAANAAIVSGGHVVQADSLSASVTSDFETYRDPDSAVDVKAGRLSVFKLPL